MILQLCSPKLKILSINCKPFYFPSHTGQSLNSTSGLQEARFDFSDCNMKAMKEWTVVDFRKSPAPPAPITLCDSPVNSVLPLPGHHHHTGPGVEAERLIHPETQQRMDLLKKFILPTTRMVHFYTTITESILTSSITIWYAAATAKTAAHLPH